MSHRGEPVRRPGKPPERQRDWGKILIIVVVLIFAAILVALSFVIAT